jgi:hypothetical protein
MPVSADKKRGLNLAEWIKMENGLLKNMENRVLRRNALKLLFWRSSAHPCEKDAYLDLPATEIRPKNRWLAFVLYFERSKRLFVAAERKLTASQGSEVANPLSLSPRRDQIQTAIEI